MLRVFPYWLLRQIAPKMVIGFSLVASLYISERALAPTDGVPFAVHSLALAQERKMLAEVFVEQLLVQRRVPLEDIQDARLELRVGQYRAERDVQ